MPKIYRDTAIEKLSSPDQLDKSIVISSSLSWLCLIGILIVIIAVMMWVFTVFVPQTMTVQGFVCAPENTNAIYSDVSGRVIDISDKINEKIPENEKLCEIEDDFGKIYTVRSEQNCIISEIKINVGDEIKRGDELFVISPVSDSEKVVVCYVPMSDIGTIEIGREAIITPVTADGTELGRVKGKVVNKDNYPASKDRISRVLGSNESVHSHYGVSAGLVCAVTIDIKDVQLNEEPMFSAMGQKKTSLTNHMVVDVKIVTDESLLISKLLPGG